MIKFARIRFDHLKTRDFTRPIQEVAIIQNKNNTLEKFKPKYDTDFNSRMFYYAKWYCDDSCDEQHKHSKWLKCIILHLGATTEEINKKCKERRLKYPIIKGSDSPAANLNSPVDSMKAARKKKPTPKIISNLALNKNVMSEFQKNILMSNRIPLGNININKDIKNVTMKVDALSGERNLGNTQCVSTAKDSSVNDANEGSVSLEKDRLNVKRRCMSPRVEDSVLNLLQSTSREHVANENVRHTPVQEENLNDLCAENSKLGEEPANGDDRRTPMPVEMNDFDGLNRVEEEPANGNVRRLQIPNEFMNDLDGLNQRREEPANRKFFISLAYRST